MAAGNVAMSNPPDVAGNVQRVEAGSLLPHGMSIADTVKVRTVAEADGWVDRSQAQATSYVAEAKSTGAEACRRAVSALSSICDVW